MDGAKKSFNLCPARDPPNWLGELSWLPSTPIFLELPVESVRELEEEQGAFSEKIFQVYQHIQHILGVAAVKVLTLLPCKKCTRLKYDWRKRVHACLARSWNQDQFRSTSEAQLFKSDLWQTSLLCERHTDRERSVCIWSSRQDIISTVTKNFTIYKSKR